MIIHGFTPLSGHAPAFPVRRGGNRVDTGTCYTKLVSMKNVTVTLDEETARWARIAHPFRTPVGSIT
jgi:hypothetical protein